MLLKKYLIGKLSFCNSQITSRLEKVQAKKYEYEISE
jgi:hypothetical protein